MNADERRKGQLGQLERRFFLDLAFIRVHLRFLSSLA